MGSRDHSIECDDCGLMRGGLNDLACDCDPIGNEPYLHWSLMTLAANLAIGAALCRAFDEGARQMANCALNDEAVINENMRDHAVWIPGCQRNAP